MEIALDLAYQCAPDHPWVKEHPEWFRMRPDGKIQYAENPPKKYQDIYPIDFESEDWEALWDGLRDVVLFWIDQGVTVFRVDNPHTKAFEFWEWMIRTVQADHPDAIFLAEAFTRPKVMYRLAKLGFTQSYTYFTWRDTPREFVEYLTELTRTEAREFFRPNFWPNTPDILPEHLQTGGRAAFTTRFVMAATLSPNYGIYGPAFELMENVPREPGSEEYLDSEKYEQKTWNLDARESLAEFIGLVNDARRENPALHSNRNLVFHPVDNERLLVYSQATDDLSSAVIVAANLDFHHAHGGWVSLDLAALGLGREEPFQVHDVLTDARYVWCGPRNYIHLDPAALPVHLFVVRREVRREHNFDYFG